MAKIFRHELQPFDADTSSSLKALIMSCLEKDPSKRPDMTEFIDGAENIRCSRNLTISNRDPPTPSFRSRPNNPPPIPPRATERPTSSTQSSVDSSSTASSNSSTNSSLFSYSGLHSVQPVNRTQKSTLCRSVLFKLLIMDFSLLF